MGYQGVGGKIEKKLEICLRNRKYVYLCRHSGIRQADNEMNISNSCSRERIRTLRESTVIYRKRIFEQPSFVEPQRRPICFIAGS